MSDTPFVPFEPGSPPGTAPQETETPPRRTRGPRRQAAPVAPTISEIAEAANTKPKKPRKKREAKAKPTEGLVSRIMKIGQKLDAEQLKRVGAVAAVVEKFAPADRADTLKIALEIFE